MTSDKFWIVFATADDKFVSRHDDRQTAESKAKALSSNCPGTEYIVAEAVLAYFANVPIATINHLTDIPF